MINWKVRYYNGSLPLQEISSEDMDYNDLPKTGIVDIFVDNGSYSHRISGMDFYWIDGDSYGMFNRTGEDAEIEEQKRLEAGHEQVVYEGHSSVKWEWNSEGEHLFSNGLPLVNIYILEGVMLPDEIAKEIGLI